MKNSVILIVILLSILLAVIFFAISLWLKMSNIQISDNGVMAIFTGAFFTILLGIGLMSLTFFSSRSGIDEQVDYNLDDLFKKNNNS